MSQQVSVFAENRPGKIERITSVLAEKGINIRAVTITDSGEYGIIKLLLDNPVAGSEALQEKGIAATLKDIVAVRIEDSPGGLHDVALVLSNEGINVEDAYGFSVHDTSDAVFIFQVANVPHAEKIIRENGFSVLSERELYLL